MLRTGVQMARLSARGQRWLKLLHIVSACVWVGCGVALTVTQLFLRVGDGSELYGRLATLDFIDLWVLVPGAIGCLLTSLAFSLWTNWGWFKHRFITVKWVICLGGILFGTFALGPWLSGLAATAKLLGLGALTDPGFVRGRTLLLTLGSLQASTLVFAAAISVLKPWKRKLPAQGS